MKLRGRARAGRSRVAVEIDAGIRGALEPDEKLETLCGGRIIDKHGAAALSTTSLCVALTDRRLLLFLIRNKGFTWHLARPPELLVQSPRSWARASFDPQHANLSMRFDDGFVIGPRFVMRTPTPAASAAAAKIAQPLAALDPSD